MEKLSFEAVLLAEVFIEIEISINSIHDHRMAQFRKMNTDLMLAPRHDLGTDKTESFMPEFLFHLVGRQGTHRRPFPTLKSIVHRSCSFPQQARDERAVFFLDLSIVEHLLECLLSSLMLRHDQAPGSIRIQPVNQKWLKVFSLQKSFQLSLKRFPKGNSFALVDSDPWLFVHHDKILMLEEHIKPPRLFRTRLSKMWRLITYRDVIPEFIAFLEHHGFFRPHSIHPQTIFPKNFLNKGVRKFALQIGKNSFSVICGSNRQGFHRERSISIIIA